MNFKLKSVAVYIFLVVFPLEIHGAVVPTSVEGVNTINEFIESKTSKQEPNCNISDELLQEIKSYESIANQIIDVAVNGNFKGRTYDQLARFVDKHINRMTGTKELEDAIDYMMEKMVSDGLQNVRAESVEVPHWIRGEEQAEIIEPTKKKLSILGLGPSVGTASEGISAEVLVVHSFDELEEKKDLVNGKIVVYNQGWLGSYGETGVYRRDGPSRAAKYGAVAVLVESITPASLNTPHTGGTNYDPDVPLIPAACITREDAELFSRISEREEKIVVNLTMLDELLSPVQSRNGFGEIIGREFPDEIVGVSGHIDAWDVGQGAMDDAGGVLISTESLALIQHLGLTPRRTLQAILWTAEEQGVIGVQAFVNEHQADMIKYNAVFEADIGTFKPIGLDFAGTPEAGCIVQEILKLLAPINATAYARYPIVGSDISIMEEKGVPGLSLNTENELYFNYHHSPADMMNVLDPVEMDLNTALWATVSYVLADLSVSLPRENFQR